MTPLQWLALAVGVLIVLPRLPAIIWPERFRDRMLALLSRGGRRFFRVLGALLWTIAVAIALLVTRPLSLLDGVMLFVMVLFAFGGLVCVLLPDAYRNLAEQILGDAPPRAIRLLAGLGVLLGCALIHVSVRG